MGGHLISYAPHQDYSGSDSFLAFIKLSVFAADKIGGGPGAVVVSILLTQAGGQKGNYPGPPN